MELLVSLYFALNQFFEMYLYNFFSRMIYLMLRVFGPFSLSNSHVHANYSVSFVVVAFCQGLCFFSLVFEMSGSFTVLKF